MGNSIYESGIVQLILTLPGIRQPKFQERI